MGLWQKIFILLFAFSANMPSVYALSEKEFCDSFVYLLKQQDNQQKISFVNKLKIMFAPRMLISSKQLDDKYTQRNKLHGEKYIFVHLERPVVDRQSIDSFREVQSRVNLLPLMEKLKEAKNIEACMSLVTENGEDFKIVQDYIQQYQMNEKNLKALTEVQMNKVLKKKLQTFERKGWNIQFMNDLFEMYQVLQMNKSIDQAMLIMHSDENGKVYDAAKNVFPKGAFSNLPPNIKKLIVFSCHGEKVIDYYNIKNKINEFDYYFPTVHPSVKSFYETKIPLVAIKGMLKVAKQDVSSELSSQRSCSVRIEAANPGKNIVVALNDEFIGTLKVEPSQEIKFDCKKLNNKANKVGIYHLGTTERNSPSIQSLIISTAQESRVLSIKEHLSKLNNQHILTIGTTGGIQ